MTESVDLAPTILDWLGAEIPLDWNGRSLLKHVKNQKNEIKSDVPLSTDKDDEFLLKHVDEVLLGLDFYDQNSSRQVKARLKRLLKKARPDKLEVGILRGFLSKIQELLNK